MTDLDVTATAALELARAGRGETALRLLDASPPDDPRIALAAAEVALELALRKGLGPVRERIKAAERACGRTWEVDFLDLRADYFEQLFGGGFGPDGKDPAVLEELCRRAGELAEGASDQVRAGWAHMFHGLVLDNLVGDRSAAPAHYAVALEAGEAGDDLLTWEALRHLGDHDRDGGNLARARERWERATALGAGAGKVGGTLAQQMLLAVLARDEGDEAGAIALAREISRWTEAIGAARQHQQAVAFLAGETIA
ncbi:hypothetical protein [Paractinoplanes lichenicola]|uniref:Sel1 repeat family protein n=1 Tax=Paractinoplanes lichenicola TaxID=2802976 RepID=A0ABS1VW65_9ACTN|nr:hypothetical protein [Actinoplanes lichenicola]MBL7258728.1 hypothetical protein [Actinoplanes lichenicola]